MREEVAGRAPNLWRYHQLCRCASSTTSCIGEGMTPLLELPTYGAQLGVPDLRMRVTSCGYLSCDALRSFAIGRK